MIKGCTKRVMVVKDVQSDIFEEAYFILRPVSEKRKTSATENDIISEANRIVSSRYGEKTSGAAVVVPHKSKKHGARIRDFLFFAAGFAAAFSCFGLFFLV